MTAGQAFRLFQRLLERAEQDQVLLGIDCENSGVADPVYRIRFTNDPTIWLEVSLIECLYAVHVDGMWHRGRYAQAANAPEINERLRALVSRWVNQRTLSILTKTPSPEGRVYTPVRIKIDPAQMLEFETLLLRERRTLRSVYLWGVGGAFLLGFSLGYAFTLL